jgi:UDP-glucuronate 4-epimerase
MRKILVTGCAGFIGSHLVDDLLNNDYEVVGVDNFNDYYDPNIKRSNLKWALKNSCFKLYNADIVDFETIKSIFIRESPEVIVHLAARAGVRPSLNNPILYSEVNKIGTINLLKLSVDFRINKFVFASSSSVYGNSGKIPFMENDQCLDIISPYGASKRAAEIFIETFNRVYGLKAVVLRFFTVYGPRGRPDMAPALFANAVMKGSPINQFGDGMTLRDYTYVADIVDGIQKSIIKDLDFEIINLGNNNPVSLLEFISILETALGKRAKIVKKPLLLGDVQRTWANIEKAKNILGWTPKTKISSGIKKYIEWLN